MGPDIQDVMQIANRMLWLTFVLSLPMLCTALVVGVAISIVQTVTSVQEMTVTFVPKLVAMLLTMALTLPWTNTLMMEYTREVLALMAGIPDGY